MPNIVDFLPIFLVFLGAGPSLSLGLIFGFAVAVEYRNLVGNDWTRGYSPPYWSLYWPFVKRSFWIAQSLGWCLLAWIFRRGPTLIFIISAVIGFIIGNIAGLRNPQNIFWVRKSIIFGLICCAMEYILELVDSQFSSRLLGPLGVGLIYSGISAIVFLVIWGILKLIRPRLIHWAFAIIMISSLFLIPGDPFIWMVVASAVAFGYSSSARYLEFPFGASNRAIILQGFLTLAVAHTLFQLYFYEIARYGIFWNPGVVVSPYALGGIIVGISVHRGKVISFNGSRRVIS